MDPMQALVARTYVRAVKVAFGSILWVLVCLFGMPSTLLAGEKYLITLKGTAYRTKASGSIGGTTVTETTMIRKLAAQWGRPEANLALAYHVGGNSMGDTIDLVDKVNHEVLETLYGLYFGTAFARRALYTSDGKEEHRLDYIYTRQSGVALGSATISKKQIKIKSGTRPYIAGSMQWIVMPEWESPAQIYTAKFTTGSKLSF